MMGSEDFAFVLQEVPGTFVGLFTTPPELAGYPTEFNHSPRVIFDDAVLGDQAAALAAMAYGRLQRAAQDTAE
jgi:hippurate hydrolase